MARQGSGGIPDRALRWTGRSRYVLEMPNDPARPGGPPAGPRRGDPRREGEVLTQTRRKVARPPKYKVLLYNDDYTPMEFVVAILENLFGKSPTEATQIMLADPPHRARASRASTCRRSPRPRSRRCTRLAEAARLPAARGRGEGMSRISRELHSRSRRRVREARRAAPRTTSRSSTCSSRCSTTSAASEILHHAGADLPRAQGRARALLRATTSSSCPATTPTRRARRSRSTACSRTRSQHCEGAEKDEVDAGDLLAAIFQEPDSHAVTLLRAQGVTRLDVLQYISHGVSKRARRGRRTGPRACRPAATGSASAGELPADPLAAFATNLTERARAGQARSADRARRRARPRSSTSSRGGARTTRSSSARPASARPRSPRASRCASARAACPTTCATPRSTRSTSARCSPARATAATSRRASRRCMHALQRARRTRIALHRRDPHDPRRGRRRRARPSTPRTC